MAAALDRAIAYHLLVTRVVPASNILHRPTIFRTKSIHLCAGIVKRQVIVRFAWVIEVGLCFEEGREEHPLWVDGLTQIAKAHMDEVRWQVRKQRLRQCVSGLHIEFVEFKTI